ncbi:MAG: DUF4131 domain-containing protein, partial [Verrucomicrobiaceae bacterium]
MKPRWQWLKSRWAALSAWGRQLREPLFGVGVAAITGILLADWRSGMAAPWSAAAAVTVLLALAARMAGRSGGWRVYLAALSVFGLLHTLRMRDPLRETVAAHLHAGAATTARVTGVVRDAPVESAGGGSWSFPLSVERLTAGQDPWPAGGAMLYARVTETLTPPVYGDRVELSGILIRPREVRNPGEFDFAAFLLRNGYSAQFTAGGRPEECRILARG